MKYWSEDIGRAGEISRAKRRVRCGPQPFLVHLWSRKTHLYRTLELREQPLRKRPLRLGKFFYLLDLSGA